MYLYLQVEAPNERDSQEYATLEVAKERDRLYYNSCVETEKSLQLPTDWELMRLEENVARTPLVTATLSYFHRIHGRHVARLPQRQFLPPASLPRQ